MTHFTVEFQTTGQAAYGRLLSKHQLASTWTVMPSQQQHSVAQQAIGLRGPHSRFKPGTKARARTPGGSREPGGAHLVTHVPTVSLEEASVSSLVASSAGLGTPTASPMPPGALSPSGDVANWHGDRAGSPPPQPPPAAAQAPAVLSPALEEEPEAPASFLDHPAARSPVAPPPAEATRRGRKPRAPPPPRIIPDVRPLYYFHGVTGYDCVQHRSSSGMYGSRPFSLRASDAFGAQKGARDDPWGGSRFAHQDTSTGSPANSSMGREHSPSGRAYQVFTRVPVLRTGRLREMAG